MLPLRKHYCNLFSWDHIRLFYYPANKHSVLITWFYVWFLGVKTLFMEPGESVGERVYRIGQWQAER